MKPAALVLSAVFVAATAGPAHAQLGALGKIKKGADKAVDTKQKVDDLKFTDEEERKIGEDVSSRLRTRFGVMQDAAVTKYVTLVGTAVAQASSKPAMDWKFIVLDSDGVNAYAAPGGFIHVTRGLLGLLKNESELAGVLGHELTHVTQRHTIDALRRANIGKDASEAAGGGSLRNELIAKLANKAFQDIFSGQWSQANENESDKIGVQVANKAGYDPHGLASALLKVADRNANTKEPNGFFVSHPIIKDRIAAIEKEIKDEKLTGKAVVEARYKQAITFDVKPLADIPTVEAGASGLASGEKKKEEPKEEKKKGGFGLSSITGGKQQASSQQTSSAGARGVGPDRDAKGGSNPAVVPVKVTAAEIDAFKKGIA